MKNAFFTLVLFLSCFISSAQDQPEEEKKGFQKEKIFVGGNFGLAFGDYTLINISPQVGYRFSNLFAAGLGINAQYISVKDYYTNGQTFSKTSEGVTGLNIFGRIYPVDEIMIQIQPEANYRFGNIKFYDAGGNLVQKTKADAVIVPSLLIGGGAVIPSGRGAFIASVFYDILQDKNSPYGARPIYNFGFNIGL
jgi:hypothetical protein